jgi:hypothetical protein
MNKMKLEEFDFETYSPTSEEKTLGELLTDMRGNISAAARGCYLSRRSLYRRIEKSAYLKTVLADSREIFLDECESVLLYHIHQNNLIAAIFVLKTLGKHRGYTEKSDMNINARVMTVADLVAKAAKEEKRLREAESSDFEN